MGDNVPGKSICATLTEPGAAGGAGGGAAGAGAGEDAAGAGGGACRKGQ